MAKCAEAIKKIGVLPVINITSVELAVPLAKALLSEGINVIEVTLRSDCSLEAIKAIKNEYPQMIIGAGTVLETESVDKAISAGAEYMVMPGYDEEIVDYCIKNNIEVFPCCTTGAEIQNAYKKGLRVLKFFPAEQNGGIKAIELFAGAFKGLSFVPTGGINFDNLANYLSSKAVCAVGGSFMANADMLKAKDFDAIRAACKRAMDISLGFELAHVGLNHENADEAMENTKKMAEMFRLDVLPGNSSNFSGEAVEFMKTKFYGEKGHIGYKTRSSYRALAYFESKGYKVREESIKYKPDGRVLAAYLEDEIGGFALHIVEK